MKYAPMVADTGQFAADLAAMTRPRGTRLASGN
jgi:hypothetical protein